MRHVINIIQPELRDPETVWNSLNYHTKPIYVVESDLPSLTVPDQTMSMREMIERHTRGMSVMGQNDPYYGDGTEYGVNPRTLDLVDRQILKEELEDQVKQIRSKQLDIEQQANEIREKEKQELEALRKAAKDSKKDVPPLLDDDK